MASSNLFFSGESAGSAVSAAPWVVLVVDDDPDVHGSTDIALHGLSILGRPVRLLHAYSAMEADGFLDGEPDIAMLLLDVVMEGGTAGLELVNRIRNERQRSDIRIALRTAQPGYAPELDVVRDYDINDYHNKNSLDHARLITIVTVNLRAFDQITKLQALAGL